MENDAYLVAANDGKGAPTGFYKCSLCIAEFSDGRRNPAELAANFSIHVTHEHRGYTTNLESVTRPPQG